MEGEVRIFYFTNLMMFLIEDLGEELFGCETWFIDNYRN